MAFKVVMTFSHPACPHDEGDYRKMGMELAIIPCQTEDELITATRDADAVITTSVQRFGRRVIENLTRCKLIHNLPTGYEGIDLEAATEHGICVSFAGDYCAEEVAEHTMALVLACARKLLRIDKAVRAGKWDSYQKVEMRQKIWPPMFRLRGQTLGLIGFGRIPRCLVPKAKGLGLRIIAFDPYVTSDIFEESGVESVALDYLLRESDYVSLHAYLTPGTKHILGMDEFRKMKPTAYLINTARGLLIDEQALHIALSQGYIAGAGLDVLETEAVSPEHPLLQLENVIITAHSAFYSEQSNLELGRRPYEEICRIWHGEWPRWLLNPQVKEKFMSRWGRR
jgi:D-3-phosphoglycerate dehydrogenase